MTEQGAGERSEAATPRRLDQARAEGQVALSPELAHLASLAAAAAALALAGPRAASALARQAADLLATLDRATPGTALTTVWRVVATTAAPCLAAAALAALAATLAQTRGLIRPAALRPDPGRLDPRQNLARMFGAHALVETGKSVAKLAGFLAGAYAALPPVWRALGSTASREPISALTLAATVATRLLAVALAVQGTAAAADYAWSRLRHARSLRMSKEDVRAEQKDTEGDPRIKARIKQIRLARAKRRMMAQVRAATVVVTNPTHYAVALAYARDRGGAPRVVAKGSDDVAARIREVAEGARVPTVANPPLARALFLVPLDTEIPAALYQAVAEIIAYVWRLDRRAAVR